MSGIIGQMSFSAGYQAHSYEVATPIYEGPLDLLLYLIERAELDITKLALAQVTDQYLAHLHNMPELPAEEVSAFLVIAAKLLQIKSEALLPRPLAREEGEEDLGEALARQLTIYRRFKRIANYLELRQANGMNTYLRIVPSQKIAASLDLSGLTLEDLINAARTVFDQADNRLELKSLVPPSLVTIRQKISLIAATLRQQSRTTFQRILGNVRSRIEIVVTFLALLELIKRHIVQARQEILFGEIEIEQTSYFDESEEFELEFGE